MDPGDREGEEGPLAPVKIKQVRDSGRNHLFKPSNLFFDLS